MLKIPETPENAGSFDLVVVGGGVAGTAAAIAAEAGVDDFLAEAMPEGKLQMIRDFQARNIMVNDNDEVFFIDYQSAMKGPLMYDVISFLYQAKANFPEDFREEMLSCYFSLWKDENTVKELKNSAKPIQLIRFMQVLGAYGFRGLIQRKPHFLSSIDKGIENLEELANSWDGTQYYAELKKLITALKSNSVQNKIKTILNH